MEFLEQMMRGNPPLWSVLPQDQTLASPARDIPPDIRTKHILMAVKGFKAKPPEIQNYVMVD
jgi:hypothetical protein